MKELFGGLDCMTANKDVSSQLDVETMIMTNIYLGIFFVLAKVTQV